MNRSRAAILAFAFAFAGCATSPEVTSWNMAREVNTPAAYRNYLERHPDSGHAAEARERVESSKMEQVMKADSVAECVRAMKTNPDPKIAATVAELAAKAARNETSVEALYDFLVYFKGNGSIPEIRSRVEELEFKGAGADPSPAALEYFLLRYPKSRYAAEARTLFAEKSYAQVKAWGSPYGFKGFLERFPDSPRAAEVRGWIREAAPAPGEAVSGESLARAVENSPALKRYAGALALSERIGKDPADVDALRRALYDLEKGGSPGLSEGLAPATLAAKPGSGEALGEALRTMARIEEHRKALAAHWKAYSQGEEMAGSAIVASEKVADELEAAELSEDVLGAGPLGGLDVGREKGSASARKALERFRLALPAIARDRADIKRQLLETDGYFKPLQYYVTGVLVAQSLPGGGR